MNANCIARALCASSVLLGFQAVAAAQPKIFINDKSTSLSGIDVIGSFNVEIIVPASRTDPIFPIKKTFHLFHDFGSSAIAFVGAADSTWTESDFTTETDSFGNRHYRTKTKYTITWVGRKVGSDPSKYSFVMAAPEPGTWMLMTMGLVGVLFAVRRKH